MRRSKITAAILGALSLTLIAEPALAYDFDTHGVHVTLIEPSAAPTTLEFQIDTTVGTCTAGSYLTWTVQGSDEATQIANAAGVLSLLLTALVGGRPINVAGYNSGCTVSHIQVQ